jgi:hypothetical protein
LQGTVSTCADVEVDQSLPGHTAGVVFATRSEDLKRCATE